MDCHVNILLFLLLFIGSTSALSHPRHAKTKTRREEEIVYATLPSKALFENYSSILHFELIDLDDTVYSTMANH